MQFGIGQSVLRVEDHRLIRGQGKFTDDINLPGQAWLHVVRSPHANARIRRIDVETARGAPGVVAVLTGHDYAAEGFGVALIDFLNIKGGDFRYRVGYDVPQGGVRAKFTVSLRACACRRTACWRPNGSGSSATTSCW